MGAGSAKGVSVTEDDGEVDADRFSLLSQATPIPEAKHHAHNNNNNNGSSKIRDKIAALAEDSDSEDLAAVGPSATGDKKEDEKKKGLFGFGGRKDEEDKTNAFVHEVDEVNKKNKKDSKFKFFNFKKDGSKKSEEKDERLDQEIKDLQMTFDSLGIAGKKLWDEDFPPTKGGEGGKSAKKSQSADDIRDLEPMRNRMTHKRRFSRPANAGGSYSKKGGEVLSTSSGGSRRTFKYSWEKENRISSPVRSEEWNYEAVVIDGFDIDKFKKANFDDTLLTGSISSRIPNSVFSENSPLSSASGTRTPLIYDTTEQKILANIEREFI